MEEKKLQVPSLTLRYQAKALNTALKGAFVNKVQELPNYWLRFKVRTKEGGQNLVFSPVAPFLAQEPTQARHQTSGYGAVFRKHLANKRIEGVEQHGSERILVFHFSDYHVVTECFGKGNTILVDADEVILAARAHKEWKARSLKKGEKYQFPPLRGSEPDEADTTALEEALEGAPDVVRALVTGFGLAPAEAEEVCARTEVAPETESTAVEEAQKVALVEALRALRVTEPALAPQVVQREKERVLLPFPFKSQKGVAVEEFEDLDTALSANLLAGLDQAKAEALREEEGEKKERAHREGQQREALKRFEKVAVEARKQADSLYANYVDVQKMLQDAKAVQAGKLTKEWFLTRWGTNTLKPVELDLKKGTLTLEEKP